MAKDRKLKLRSHSAEGISEQETSLPAPSFTTREVTPNLSLADIRGIALKQRTDVAHTIADLEAWMAEIAATIAFLKGRS